MAGLLPRFAGLYLAIAVYHNARLEPEAARMLADFLLVPPSVAGRDDDDS